MYFNATGLTSRRHDAEGAFVHVSAVEQSGLTGLADNQAIEFDLIEGREGRQMAGNLRKG